VRPDFSTSFLGRTHRTTKQAIESVDGQIKSIAAELQGLQALRAQMIAHAQIEEKAKADAAKKAAKARLADSLEASAPRGPRPARRRRPSLGPVVPLARHRLDSPRLAPEGAPSRREPQTRELGRGHVGDRESLARVVASRGLTVHDAARQRGSRWGRAGAATGPGRGSSHRC
jgi:hypothetical protein